MHEVHDTTLLGIIAKSPAIFNMHGVSINYDDEDIDRVKAATILQNRVSTEYPMSVDLLTGHLEHVTGDYAVFASLQLDDFDYHAGAGDDGRRFYEDVVHGSPHESYTDRLLPFLDSNATIIEPDVEPRTLDRHDTDVADVTVEHPNRPADDSPLTQTSGPEVWAVPADTEYADAAVKIYERVPFSEPLRTVDDLKRELAALLDNMPYWDEILPQAEQAGRDIITNNDGIVPSLHDDHPGYVYREASR